MPFHCVLAGPLSDELKAAMSVRTLDELAGKEVSTLAAMRVPTACGPASSMDEDMSAVKVAKSHRMH